MQSRIDVKTQAALAFLGLCGIAIVLLSTSRYGPGTFGDAEHYLAAAKSLLAGQGYRYSYGAPYTQWPPLFPTLLAGLGLMGLDPLTSARWLNAVTFGLIVFCSGQLFLKCTAARWLAVAGTLAILSARTVVEWSAMAASEPVFTLLVILFGLGIVRFLKTRTLRDLVLVSAVVALASLQRYAGISLTLAGVVLIALNLPGVRWLRRLGFIVIFSAVSVAPLALWGLRNRMVAGRNAGDHHLSMMSWAGCVEAARAAAREVTTWFVPWTRPKLAQPLDLVFILLSAGVLILVARAVDARRRSANAAPAPSADDGRGLQIWSAAVAGLIYFGFLVVTTSSLGWLPENRHLVPIYTFTIAVLVGGIDAARRLLSAWTGRAQVVGSVIAIVCMLWLQYPLRVLYRDTVERVHDGAGGFATAAWQEGPLVQWLRGHPLSDKVYSNGSDLMYFLTGSVTPVTPRLKYETELADFVRASASQPRCIVWFNKLQRSWLNDLPEILSRCRTETIVTFPEGGVYRCLGPGGSGVSGVYRFWSSREGRHFYTIDKAQRDKLRLEASAAWVYEQTPFYAFEAAQPGTCPVYRLRSERLNTWFFTISAAERDTFVQDSSSGWTYVDIAFYVYPEKTSDALTPVYRLRSTKTGCYFYTAESAEKQKLIGDGSRGWVDEGIAWYAYGPRPTS